MSFSKALVCIFFRRGRGYLAWSLFSSIILLKLLETLPKASFQAAKLDNARTWEIYAFIARPMLSVMTRGGLGVATETLDMYAFSQGFVEAGRISYASAMAVLILVATIIIFKIILKWMQKWQTR